MRLLIMQFSYFMASIYCLSIHQPLNAAELQHQIAEAYGLSQFNQIEEIDFTFNVMIGQKNIQRKWSWHPASGKVTLFPGDSQNESSTYFRNELKTSPDETLKKIDHWFVNDVYWLLFPFQVAWDKTVMVQDMGIDKLPIGQGSARRIMVTYPSEGGYTPGDIYEMYVDDNHLLVEWVYRQGGSEMPTRISTWEKNQKVGPILISMEHQGKDENFRVWFTDVKAKLKGSDRWVTPK